MNKLRFLTKVWCLGLVICLPTILSANQDSPTEEQHRLFTLKVLPILKSKCLGCHGGDNEDIKANYSVFDRELLLRGGESGEAAIIPGEPNAGTLLAAIRWEGLEMPPKENDRLTDEEIEWFEQWIQNGAVWPSEEKQQAIREQSAREAVTAEGVIVKTSGGTSDEWTMRRYQPEDLWAFQPVKTAGELLPDGIHSRQAIDYFVIEKLAEANLTPGPQATARDLIRRATYDLTGLPPTLKEIVEFEKAYNEKPEQAWTALIDRLLASPRYGEHWARHWLDVTRYADTGGMSNDFERSNMWRYRDYVIRAFNSDKPYDRFIIEQIAGDELADQSFQRRTNATPEKTRQAQVTGSYNAEEAEWIVATGFLRMGPWDNAMIDAAEARQIYLDDLVNITGQTFLSQTLRCCKCHDHKFDPIPTRDYYRLYSAFSTTQLAERPVPFLSSENLEQLNPGKSHVQKMLDFARKEKQRIKQLQEDAARVWYDERGLNYKTESERADDPDDKKPPRHVGLNIAEQGQLKVREQDEWIWNRRLERYEPLAQSVYNSPRFQIAWNGARHLRVNHQHVDASVIDETILLGGDLNASGDPVSPGVLSAVGLTTSNKQHLPEDVASRFGLANTVNGRRLGLAQWIAHRDNSLTTRSIVNRIWLYHFGRGIAGNPNNFGATGDKPTHPELLDFLADEFVSNGWSIKKLHRRIMMSHTYRRSTTDIDAEQREIVDPDNRLLSFFPRRRLTAEELRDSILSATGELTHCDGGLPVMPEINMEVALQPRMLQFSLAPAYQPSPRPELRNRRTVYSYHVRGQANPFTEIFNQPNPNESCEFREEAVVTPQVFTLMNSNMITDRSIAMALRLQDLSDDKDQQIQFAFQRILLRSPTLVEQTRMIQYRQEMLEYHGSFQPKSVKYPTSITRSLVEEFSGETFEYEEILPAFEDYEADRKAHEVSPETRSLADVCLLLFNTNEFIFIE